MKAVFLCDKPHNIPRVWTPEQVRKLQRRVDIPETVIESPRMAEHAGWLSETEVIFSTWGMPLLTRNQLDLMPNLKAVFYAAGTVKRFAAPLLERDITVVSAWAINAVPVAEFTLAQILFSMKLGWHHVIRMRANPGPAAWKPLDLPGNYDGRVGIVSLGMTGRKLCELLSPFRLHKQAFDPYADDAAFAEAGATRCGLGELFQTSDVVTLHAPLLQETEGMITGELIASMKPNATLINTSRGAIIREAEMAEVLRARRDLVAVLDVAQTEPPPAGSPLYRLENAILTPHIAGSMGREVLRMSDLMIEEFQAWREARPLRYAVTSGLIGRIA